VRLRIDGPDAEGMGRISLSSATAALGYWKRADLTRASFRDGWFYSHDIGRLDRDGNLHVLDRLEDVIEKNDRRFFPRDIEECIHRVSGVKECAVVWDGREVTAYVAPRAGVRVGSGAIREFCVRNLPPEAVPSGVLVVDRLPRSTSGKILKRQLRSP
jgi:long-chain acyl-CoA synthetase